MGWNGYGKRFGYSFFDLIKTSPPVIREGVLTSAVRGEKKSDLLVDWANSVSSTESKETSTKLDGQALIIS